MRIGQTPRVSIRFGGRGPSASRRVEPAWSAAETGEEAPRSTALVPVEAPRAAETAGERLVRHRVHAPFLAQLIATHEGMAETRRLRRASPQRAAAGYAAAAEGPGLLVPGYLVDVRG